MEYYSAMKKNETMPAAATWTGLELITLTEAYKRQVITQYYLYVKSKKNNTNELIYKTETDSLTSQIKIWLLKGKGKGREKLGFGD